MKILRVTTVLRLAGIAPDFSAIPPAILEHARVRGTAVHAACEAIDCGGEHVPSLDAEDITGYVAAYRLFLSEANFAVIDCEQRLTHPTLGYTGQYDAKGWLNNHRTILDRKATATVAPAVAIQLAAYELMHNAVLPDEPVAMRVALHLRRDGTYRLHRYQSPGDTQVWLAALEIARQGPQIEQAQEIVARWISTNRQ